MANSPSLSHHTQLSIYLSGTKQERALVVARNSFTRILQTEPTVPKWLQPKLRTYYVVFWEPNYLVNQLYHNRTYKTKEILHQGTHYTVCTPEGSTVNGVLLQSQLNGKQVSLSFREPKDFSIEPVVYIQVAR